MIWKSNLSVFNRFIGVLIVLMSFGVHSVYAASVPWTKEGFGIGANRNTCDPAFLEVMNNRAWQEGQREITQNANIIARPDSVLSMTCFDSFMDHLTRYADNNFPGDPQYACGEMMGLLGSALSSLSCKFNEWFVIDYADLLYDPPGLDRGVGINAVNIKNPLSGTGQEGFLMYAVIELLVLDQLVDNVPSDTASDIMRGLDIVENPTLAACAAAYGVEHKQYYIEDNFPEFLIGDRASIAVHTSSTTTGTISSSISNQANNNNYACARMNQVWQASKCYDFMSESSVFGVAPDHDGFYPLKKYKDDSLLGTDYRTREVMCGIPPVDNKVPPTPRNLTFPDNITMVCNVASHGIPTGFGSWSGLLVALTALFGVNPLPTWDTAYTASNPLPGAAGAIEAYMHFLGLRDSTNCSGITPIKTGFIVTDGSGNTYVDAVCPAPGCFFTPPFGVPGTGTCN